MSRTKSRDEARLGLFASAGFAVFMLAGSALMALAPAVFTVAASTVPTHGVQRVKGALLLRAQDGVETLDGICAVLEGRLMFGCALGHESGHAVEAFRRGQGLLFTRSVLTRFVLGPILMFTRLRLHIGLEGLEGGFLVRPKVQDVVQEPCAVFLMGFSPLGVIGAVVVRFRAWSGRRGRFLSVDAGRQAKRGGGGQHGEGSGREVHGLLTFEKNVALQCHRLVAWVFQIAAPHFGGETRTTQECRN